ncbi:MAG: hypothetical protein Ta2F_06200 [Termitinemataceae bacterium]|nr:MAG: hypothetical protein Ta2F_06200 [Termitinemataceae bacterium]
MSILGGGILLQSDDELYLFEEDEIEELTARSFYKRGHEEEKLKKLCKQLAQFSKQFKNYSITLNGQKITYALPKAPEKDGRWIMSGDTVTISGHEISCGLFYFGTYLPSKYCETEPSMLNPKLSFPNIYKKVSPRPLPYSIDYSDLYPAERLSYVEWLKAGRPMDSTTKGWFLVMFLKGIERRMFVDDQCGLVKQPEKLVIKKEFERIITSPIVKNFDIPILRALTSFYQVFLLVIKDKPIYEMPINFSFGSYLQCDSIPIFISVALAECARDSMPVTADIAFAWFECGKPFKKSVPFNRCYDQFKKIFKYLYQKEYDKRKFIFVKNKSNTGYTFEDYYTHSSAINPKVRYKLPLTVSHSIKTNTLENKIIELAETCKILTESFSRILRNDKKTATEKKCAFLLLPDICFSDFDLTKNDIYLDKEPQKDFLKIIGIAKKCNSSQKTAIVKYLETHVFSQCDLSFEKISFLEKIYKKLDLDHNDLYSSCEYKTTEFSLDTDKIKKLRNDSQQAALIIEDIYKENSDETSAPPKKISAAKHPLSLDKKHSSFLMELIKCGTWKKSDLEKLAKKYGLMADGAIEIINEASYSIYNEALIEDDDICRCNKEISQKIKEAYAA